MQPITLQEPRALTRVVYGMAMRAAVSDAERAEYERALAWYELKWRAQDAQAQQPPRPAGQAPGGDA